MKSTLKKTIALLLVFCFVFAFAACKDDNKETTTAAATTSEETTATSTTAAVDETTAVGETTTVISETTTAVGETTTMPVAITAPVGGSIAQIVEFYNKYANATKAYTGKVTVNRVDGTTGKIEALKPDWQIVRDQANGMLAKLNDYPKTANKTFVNGMSGTDSLQKFLPRSDDKTLSDLQAAGVKSATCTKSGTGWKVFITLKPETMNNLNDKPAYHAQCMDTVSISDKDLEPFTLGGAVVTYQGGTINAQINDKGLLDSLKLYEPDSISGTLKWTVVSLITTTIAGTWQSETTYTY